MRWKMNKRQKKKQKALVYKRLKRGLTDVLKGRVKNAPQSDNS